MYSRYFCVTLFEQFNLSYFGSSLFLFTLNFNCMTKLCSVFKRNVKFFLNVDLGNADLDEQRKLLRPFRLMPLKHRLFVLFVKLIYHIFNDQAVVVILSLIFPTQRLSIFYLTVFQYFVDTDKYFLLNILTRILNTFISTQLNKPLVDLERFVLADFTVLYNSAKVL